MTTKINIVATGEELLGGGIRATGPLTEEIIKKAKKSIHIMIYAIAPSGIPIIEMLGEAASKGVRIYMVINKREKLSPRVETALQGAAAPYPHFQIKSFSANRELHAKIVVIDREEAIVGSANFTLSGMYRNCEVGVHIKGEESWKLANLVEQVARKC